MNALASQPERPSITRESLGAIRGDAVWHIKAETKLPYDTVATVVRAFIEDVLILASQPERVEGLTREKWSVRSIDGRVVCLYCGRGCADASYPQGTCDECGDMKDGVGGCVGPMPYIVAWDDLPRIECPTCKGTGDSYNPTMPEIHACQTCHANGWVYASGRSLKGAGEK